MTPNLKNEIQYYTNILKENEILLLKSKDEFFKTHYQGSPLNILTNFSGSSAEAILDKNGEIKDAKTVIALQWYKLNKM